MRLLGKISIGIIFTLLFLFFNLLGTIRFELLNSTFLFGSFQRNNVYATLPQVLAQSLPNDPNVPKAERGDYANIAKSIKPDTVKKIIETNFLQVLNYINGESDDIKISVSPKEIGIPGGASITWSLSQMQSKESGSKLDIAKGIGNKILLSWSVVLSLLIGLFFLFGRLTKPKSLLGGKTLLVIEGVIIIVIGIAARLFSLVMEKSMPQTLEPSQALIKLLASSLFPDIAVTWVICGVLVIILGKVIAPHASKK